MQGGAKLKITGTIVAVALLAPAMEGVCAAKEAPFIPPMSVPITRHFEAPLGPYGPGHRGIDFAAPSGSSVWASGNGKVVFAGPVADDGLFVTIDHGLGIRTTYSFLSQIDVAVGEEVRQGKVVGLSGDGHAEEGVPGLHFGAKVDGIYIDPELLFRASFGGVHLVALDAGEEPIEVVYREGQDGSILSPRDPITVPKIVAPVGFAASFGKKVESAGRAIIRVPRNVIDWGRERIDDGRRLWNRAREWGQKTATWFSAGWDRLSKLAKAGGRGAQELFEKASSKLGSAWQRLKQVADAVGLRFSKWIEDGRTLISRVTAKAKAIKQKISKVTGKFRTLKKIVKFLSKVKLVIGVLITTINIGKGAIKQVGCTLKGGGKPPAIPSKEELAKGAKAPPPPNDNIVIAVAGIGSHTAALPDGTIKANATIYNMDLRTLGYSEDRIFHYSYKGIDEAGGRGPYRLHAPYTREDTYQSIRDSAALLARHVELIHKEYPDKKIDIVAHSQGGLVAQYFLAANYHPKRLENPPIGHFVSISSPHYGADAAQLFQEIQGSSHVNLFVDGFDELSKMTGLPRISSAAVTEMAEGSGFLVELDKLWDPKTVKTTTIAATFDYVVTSPHTRLRGATHYTADLPTSIGSVVNAHGDIVMAKNTKEIIYGALSNNSLACTALRDVVADHGIGKLISSGEDFFFKIYGAVVRAIPGESN